MRSPESGQIDVTTRKKTSLILISERRYMPHANQLDLQVSETLKSINSYVDQSALEIQLVRAKLLVLLLRTALGLQLSHSDELR